MHHKHRAVSLIATLLGIVLSAAYGDDIIVDSHNTSGPVTLHKFTNEGSQSINISTNPSYFHCNKEGHFIIREAEKWYIGNVEALDLNPISKIPVQPPSEHISDAVISPKGGLIAWIDQNSLFVTVADSSQTNAVYSFSTNGIISKASWSPTNPQIAFFYENREEITGMYSLMMIDFEESKYPKQLTEPSFQSHLSLTHGFPPKWSPDGKKILFEGRFDMKDKFGACYIYEIDSGKRMPTEFGKWASDSSGLYAVRELSSGDGYALYLLKFNPDGSLNEERVGSDKVVFPETFWTFSVSPSGSRIAIVADENVFIVDAKSGVLIEKYNCTVMSEIYWVR